MYLHSYRSVLQYPARGKTGFLTVHGGRLNFKDAEKWDSDSDSSENETDEDDLKI